MQLWPVEHFCLTFFQISTDLEKKWAKSVQLVRFSSFWGDFLQNPYFSVFYMSSSICLSGVESSDFSCAEKERTA